MTSRLRDHPQLVAGAVALLSAGVLVIGSSTASFTASTDNVGNSWSAGAVQLTEDATAALFLEPHRMAPGVDEVQCVTVTYNGTVAPVDVRLFAETSGRLGRHLDVVVERGTGGGYGDCTGFTPAATVFRGTLDAMPAGWGAAQPWPIDTVRASGTYRFTVAVRDDGAEQGTSATARFVWQVRP